MTKRGLILATLAAAVSLAGGAATGLARATSSPETWTFLAAGDLLGPYGETLKRSDPEFERVVTIIAAADVAMANHEGSSFDMHTFRGAMAAENGGGYPIHTPAMMRDLKDVGFDLLARANNHSLDWGVDGLTASDAALDAIGLMHAGTGKSLKDARAANFLVTSKGRIAFLSTASSFTGMSPASDGGRGAGPRPGMAPIHAESVMLVSPSEMEALRGIAVRTWANTRPPPASGVTRLDLNEGRFQTSDKAGMTYEVSDSDIAEEMAAIAKAKTEASEVVFTIHAHETGSTDLDSSVPADFLPPLFHKAIDAGADVVVRHGPHSLQGIEIYHGKPIFYGLGSFFLDIPRTIRIANQGLSAPLYKLPEGWYESAIASAKFDKGVLSEIRVYPLLLDQRDGETRGYPRLAQGEDATRILERIKAASAQFGTVVRIEKGIGLIVGARPQ